MAVGLLSLLALSASAAKVSPESLLHGPFIPPNADQLRVAVGGDGGALLYAWVDNDRVWVKSSLSASATMLPGAGNATVRVGGIAYNGGRFLVTWLEGGVPLAARFSREGALLDGVSIRIGPVAADVDVVADPQGFRVFVNLLQTAFAMSRISTAGTLLDATPIPIGSGNPQTVITSADRFAWLDSENRQATSSKTNGLIVVSFNSRPAGDLPSPGVLSMSTGGLTRFPFQFMDPALASNGLQYFIFWHNGHEIRGARVNADGTPIDTANGMLMAVDAIAPTASPKPVQALWDGSKYLVVWEDVAANGNINIMGTYVSPNGASTWFDIAASPANERAPMLQLLDPGRVLVVYQKVGPLSTEIVSRVVSEKRERVVRR